MNATPANSTGSATPRVDDATLPRIHYTIAAWQTARASAAFHGQRIGFVPTMGALHAGHRALLERARAENDHVVLSIYVNPTQFNDPADLAKYPRTLEADIALAAGLATDVFAPLGNELYPDDYAYQVTEKKLSRELEGAHRPGHFDGVLTVVLKLLNLVAADRAYFGEKDWQQLALVRDMARAFFLPTEIIACPTVRESDGLAMSSRNRRLSPAARTLAPRLAFHLNHAATAADAAHALTADGFKVDYVEDRADRRLAAVHLDGVRLIDNVRL